jgi:hypothetical protein
MSKNWNSGKGDRADKELSKIQKLAHENKKLKMEINRLRKTISRLDSGWCTGCLDKYEGKDKEDDLPEPTLDNPVINKRSCFKCKEGQLRIIKYYKLSETHYYRSCDSCPHRTKGKKFTPDVRD